MQALDLGRGVRHVGNAQPLAEGDVVGHGPRQRANVADDKAIGGKGGGDQGGDPGQHRHQIGDGDVGPEAGAVRPPDRNDVEVARDRNHRENIAPVRSFDEAGRVRRGKIGNRPAIGYRRFQRHLGVRGHQHLALGRQGRKVGRAPHGDAVGVRAGRNRIIGQGYRDKAGQVSVAAKDRMPDHHDRLLGKLSVGLIAKAGGGDLHDSLKAGILGQVVNLAIRRTGQKAAGRDIGDHGGLGDLALDGRHLFHAGRAAGKGSGQNRRQHPRRYLRFLYDLDLIAHGLEGGAADALQRRGVHLFQSLTRLDDRQHPKRHQRENDGRAKADA